MKLKDTTIHHAEMLLTLDYLLNHTDERHPATQIDICEHANNFGLHFDAKAKNNVGNDVRRQRIGECLRFLMRITDKFPDQVPFVLETTESGKYYIEQKNYVTEEQIIKILAAVKNDKYTQDDDTDLFIERLLDSLSNVHNRDFFKKELEKLNKGVRKYNFAASRKLRLVYKAFEEGKLITIRWEILDRNKKDVHVYDFRYRVYKIKEYKNKPYAVLLPIHTGDIHFYHGMIFDQIDNLNIPDGPDRDVLCEDDPRTKEELNELFASCNKSDYRFYGDIDTMLEANVIPAGGFAFKVSFYFRLAVAKFVTQSFEEFFSRKLEYTECTSFDVLEEKQAKAIPLPHKNDKGLIVLHPLKENEEPVFGVVNVNVNLRAFQSWMLVDPHGDGFVNIGNMITVVGPKSINEHMARYYSSQLLKYKDYLNEGYLDKTIGKLKEGKE